MFSLNFVFEASVFTEVADLRFSRGGQPPRWGCKPIVCPNFPRKLHENEKNWIREAGGVPP